MHHLSCSTPVTTDCCELTIPTGCTLSLPLRPSFLPSPSGPNVHLVLSVSKQSGLVAPNIFIFVGSVEIKSCGHIITSMMSFFSTSDLDGAEVRSHRASLRRSSPDNTPVPWGGHHAATGHDHTKVTMDVCDGRGCSLKTRLKLLPG